MYCLQYIRASSSSDLNMSTGGQFNKKNVQQRKDDAKLREAKNSNNTVVVRGQLNNKVIWQQKTFQSVNNQSFV